METHHFIHKYLKISIELISHVSYLTDELLFLLSYSYVRADGNITITEHMEIMETDSGYIFTWNEKTYYDIKTKEELFWILSEVLFGDIFIVQKDWLLLHAAAVLYKGNVVVFVADSNTGKSTFSTAFSMQDNCEYITDDILPIRKSDLLCCDFHKPIYLRENNIIYTNNFKNCLSTDIFIKHNDETKRLIFPKNCSRFLKPYAIKSFVFLNRDSKYTSDSLKIIPRNIALLKIAQSFIFSEAGDIPSCAIKLVRNHKFFQLNYSSVEHIDKNEFLNKII